MQLLFVIPGIAGDTVQALCRTFLHSLWQGLAAAIIAALVIVCTRTTAARIRYNLLVATWLLFTATVITTLVSQLSQSTRAFAGDISGISIRGAISESETVAASPGTHILSVVVGYTNENASFILAAWALFFIFNCIRLASGVHGIHRMRSKATPLNDWKETFEDLRRHMHVKRAVQLLESARVRIPVAIGYLRPVILVPAGLLANLPPDQAETILMHELAHIRRHDYLVNFAQRIVESVLFFNPGLRWLSDLIRNEREACCDDMVVQHSRHHRSSYLEALVSFQEYSMKSGPFAMGIGGRKNVLLNRVRRMLTRENKKLDILEKSFLIVAILLLTAFRLMPATEPPKEPVQSPFERLRFTIIPASTAIPAPALLKIVPKRTSLLKPVAVRSSDSIPARKDTTASHKYKVTGVPVHKLELHNVSTTTEARDNFRKESVSVTDKEGNNYSYTRVNGQLTQLTVDGKNVDAADFKEYDELVDHIDGAIRQKQDSRKSEVAALSPRKVNPVSLQQRQAAAAARADEARERSRKIREQWQEKRKVMQAEMQKRQLENKSLHEQQFRKRKTSAPTIDGREIIQKESKMPSQEDISLQKPAGTGASYQSIKTENKIHLTSAAYTNTEAVVRKQNYHVGTASLLLQNQNKLTTQTSRLSPNNLRLKPAGLKRGKTHVSKEPTIKLKPLTETTVE